MKQKGISKASYLPKRRLNPGLMTGVLWVLAVIVALCTSVVHGQSALIGSISVDDNKVSTSTNFNFDLISTSETVASNDYLEIVLPSDLDSKFTSGNSNCQVESASISQCLILSSKICRIVFSTRMSTTQIKGSVSGFVNPASNRAQTNIQITLYDEDGEPRLVSYVGSLSQFETANLDVELSTSSNIIGKENAILTLKVNPDTVMLADGTLVVYFPMYYVNSGSDQMIGESPSCSADLVDIKDCIFNSASRQLTIIYETKNGEGIASLTSFEIRNFKNPVTPSIKEGFSVITTDEFGFAVAESGDVSLPAVTEPTTYQNVAFSFDNTNQVGQYSDFRITIQMATSLDYTCYVKVQFPEEFTTDFQLLSVLGTSFLQPSSGSSISLLESDLENRVFMFQACRRSWGYNPNGSIIFQKVRNPEYIKQTGSFKLWVAADYEFEKMIAQKTSDMIIEPDQLRGGKIINIDIQAADELVSATTSYAFKFTPLSNISRNTPAKITIELPETLSFNGSSCSIVSRSADFSNSMSCNLSDNTATLSYIFSNKPDFVGGTPLSVTLSEIVNSPYAQDVGPFTISTYIRVDSAYYLQDQSSTAASIVRMIPGLVTKISDVIPSSFRASQDNVQYTFDLETEHDVPVGGIVRFNLPDTTSFLLARLRNDCFRLDHGGRSTLPLDCSGNEDQNYFDIQVTSNTFGTQGLQGGERFKVRVGAIKNPREVNSQAAFQVQTFASGERLIDESTGSQYFVVTMNLYGYIESMSVVPQDPTNGVATTYDFTVKPNIELANGDILYMTFPPEVALPASYYVSCNGDSYVGVQSCIKASTDQLKITFTSISSKYNPSDDFLIQVHSVYNPVSFKPSSQFTDISLVSKFGNEMAKYFDNKMIVETDLLSTISYFTLNQSNLIPGAEAYYTITFRPDTRLPSTTAFRIKTPRQIEIIDGDVNDCYIETNKKVVNRCYFKAKDTLEIHKGMKHFSANTYQNLVTIVFLATNPPSNFYKGIELTLEISLDETFKYPISSIEGGLEASFECNYPCISCNPYDPDDCESCDEGPGTKDFLQEDVITGKKTCKTLCDLGYTWDKTVSRTCFPCDPSCSKCRMGGEVGDSKMCTGCQQGYSYAWIEEAKCYADELGCPMGTYEHTAFRCRACMENCSVCSSGITCLRCDTQSMTPLLENELCVSQCQVGKTPVYDNEYGQCVNCEYPCATCQDGNPNFCLTCADGDYQFLFGGQCLAECPLGTTRDLDTSECIGCRLGCKTCDLKDNSICIRCETGLSLYKKQCLTECPVDFKKSLDGTVCEPRTYPFDRSFVPFPFLIFLGALFILNFFCWILTRRKTLLMQVCIIQTAVVMQFALIFELFKSMAEGQPLFITFTILILIANTLLGVAFSITFHLQIDDYEFNIWREANPKAYKVMRVFFTFFSLHLFRLVYSKLFMIEMFRASATVPHDLLRPLRLYSKLFMGIILAPVLVLNVFGMIFTFEGYWDNQLQMTMFEIVCMAPLQAVFLFIEMFRADPRFLLHKATDEHPFFVSMFHEPSDRADVTSTASHQSSTAVQASSARGSARGDKKAAPWIRLPSKEKKKKVRRQKQTKLNSMAVSDAGVSGKQLDQGESYWEITDKRIRHSKLADVIRTVKSLTDLKLNMELDFIIDHEINMNAIEFKKIVLKSGEKKPDDREYDSCPDLYHGKEKVAPGEDTDLNLSFPGLNQDYINPLDKQRRLIEFFIVIAEKDGVKERERQKIELLAKMKQDKACSPDVELIDNCFFSSKQKVTAMAQTVAKELINQACDVKTVDNFSRYADMSLPQRKVSAEVPDYKSQMQRSVVRFDEEDDGEGHGHQISDRNLLASERAKREQHDLISKQQSELEIGELNINRHRRPQIAGLGYIDTPNTPHGLQLSPEHTNAQRMRKAQTDVHEFAEDISETSHEFTKSRKFKEEKLGLRDPFFEQMRQDHNKLTIPKDDEIASGDSYQKSATISTFRRQKVQDIRLKLEYKPDLSQFRIEPDRPVNSKKWLWMSNRMAQTIMVDEVQEIMKEPYEGLQIKENYGRSDRTTEKTESQLQSDKLSEKDRINGGISEESYAEDDALFYKNNYPYDTHESISSVHTEQLEVLPMKEETRKDFTAWLRENSELNQRNFNINDVLGNFPRDLEGRIKDRKMIFRRNFRDLDGQMVNERGYLINEISGAIRSRYTYEDMLIGEFGDMEEIGEIPMPFRLECYNFNPHKIIGSFKYTKEPPPKQVKKPLINEQYPVFYFNKHDQYTDSLYRPVTAKGFLINENEDIVDDEGRVVFLKSQLTLDNLMMYNYEGQQFWLNDIIGQFEKDPDSKQIILKIKDGKAVDLNGHLVNAAGYLIDDKGNIVQRNTKKIMFNFWEIMYNEPPKIFKFTEWDINWIKGNLDRDITKNPRHDDMYDLDGRLINSLGYLIDTQHNIVDQHGRLVFRREILTRAYGQDARIPRIFTSNLLLKPKKGHDTDRNETPDSRNRIIYSKQVQHGSVTAGGANYETDAVSSAMPKKGATTVINSSALELSSNMYSDQMIKPNDANKGVGSSSSQHQPSNSSIDGLNKPSSDKPMVIAELNENSSTMQLNIQTPHNAQLQDHSSLGQVLSEAMPNKQQQQMLQEQKKKKKKKQAKKEINNPPQQRYGEKMKQNLYSGYLDSNVGQGRPPTDSAASLTQYGPAANSSAFNFGAHQKPPKLKKAAPPRLNRPTKSATRNSSRPHYQTTQQQVPSQQRLFSPSSERDIRGGHPAAPDKVIMQGNFMHDSSRRDYQAMANEEIFNSSKKQVQQMNNQYSQKMTRNNQVLNTSVQSSLNTSNQALLNKNLQSANRIYSNKQIIYQ